MKTKTKIKNKKVVVAMSGGVDSSVTAALLKKQGLEVIGVTMQVWGDAQKLAISDASKVAKQLDIPHQIVDLRESFEKQVITYFTNEYLQGRTPNPCVVCNRYIKFGELLNFAKTLGADYIATGHYARVVKENERYLLKKSASSIKDQTYPLWRLTQEQLASIMFPLSGYEKTETRKLASEFALPVANKPDSQDICFVADHDYVGFIERVTGQKMQAGNFVDKNGKIIGQHKGLYHYTIGQRRGLGVTIGQPLFVTRIDAKRNEVVLGPELELLSEDLIASELNFIAFEKLLAPMQVNVKIRSHAKEVLASILPIAGARVRVVFTKAQRAVTAGQSIVFYKDDLILGGGIIQ